MSVFHEAMALEFFYACEQVNMLCIQGIESHRILRFSRVSSIISAIASLWKRSWSNPGRASQLVVTVIHVHTGLIVILCRWCTHSHELFLVQGWELIRTRW